MLQIDMATTNANPSTPLLAWLEVSAGGVHIGRGFSVFQTSALQVGDNGCANQQHHKQPADSHDS
jgi:hypothetical protein